MDDAVLDTEVTMQVSGSLLASLTDTGVDSAIYTSYFGKETTVNSWLQWGEVYGYALSTDYERSVQRSRHDDRITTNPGNSEVAQTYKGYVDEVISLQNQVIWLGVGAAIAVALAALAVAFPVAGVISEIAISSGLISTASAATVISLILKYTSSEAMLSITFARCCANE